MIRLWRALAVLIVLALLPSPCARGQFSGAVGKEDKWFGGTDSARLPRLELLEPKAAEGYITIDGRAIVRVRATEIRVVLAVISEAPTAQQCQQNIDATIAHLKAAWTKMGIAPQKIVADFIAVLPRYEWRLEKYADQPADGLAEVEKKAGYRMQTNLHLAVPGEAEAQAAMTRAFEEGVTDIIAFDYWNKDLDDVKVKARQQALKAARSKADDLLQVLFDKRPPVINVQEETTVRYPQALYYSFTTTGEDAVRVSPPNSGKSAIYAPRPRNTYYRGLVADSDVQPAELPMNAEISVISTVRLYFKSPAADSRKPDDHGGKAAAGAAKR